jgi:hypothetical protein
VRPQLRAAPRAPPHSALRAAGLRAVGEDAPGSSGAQLARALGLPLEPQPDGSVAVSFASAAAAPAPLSLLAREPSDDGAAPALDGAVAPPPPAPAQAGAPAAPPAPAGPPAPSLEDIYDHVVERLRRDLLVERERMGDLTGPLP